MWKTREFLLFYIYFLLYLWSYFLSIVEDLQLGTLLQVLSFKPPNFELSLPNPVSKPAFTNILLIQLIKTCIKRVWDYAPASLRENLNKLLKPKNLNFYYGDFYINCYYFCNNVRIIFRLSDHKLQMSIFCYKLFENLHFQSIVTI